MKALLVALLLTTPFFAHANPGAIEMKHDLAFNNGSVVAHVEWAYEPEVKKEAVLKLQWVNVADNSPVAAPGKFKLYLWMPSMGHGSGPTKIFPVVDAQGNSLPGAYEIKNIYFIMGGPWEVYLEVTNEAGVKESQKFDINFAMDHHH